MSKTTSAIKKYYYKGICLRRTGTESLNWDTSPSIQAVWYSIIRIWSSEGHSISQLTHRLTFKKHIPLLTVLSPNSMPWVNIIFLRRNKKTFLRISKHLQTYATTYINGTLPSHLSLRSPKVKKITLSLKEVFRLFTSLTTIYKWTTTTFTQL